MLLYDWIFFLNNEHVIFPIKINKEKRFQEETQFSEDPPLRVSKGLKFTPLCLCFSSGFLSPTLQAYATWLRLILQAPSVLNLQAFAHAIPSICNAIPVFVLP